MVILASIRSRRFVSTLLSETQELLKNTTAHFEAQKRGKLWPLTNGAALSPPCPSSLLPSHSLSNSQRTASATDLSALDR
ncbi:hypothetical protein ACLKA6_010522 [Drosophila palustris]